MSLALATDAGKDGRGFPFGELHPSYFYQCGRVWPIIPVQRHECQIGICKAQRDHKRPTGVCNRLTQSPFAACEEESLNQLLSQRRFNDVSTILLKSIAKRQQKRLGKNTPLELPMEHLYESRVSLTPSASFFAITTSKLGRFEDDGSDVVEEDNELHVMEASTRLFEGSFKLGSLCVGSLASKARVSLAEILDHLSVFCSLQFGSAKLAFEVLEGGCRGLGCSSSIGLNRAKACNL